MQERSSPGWLTNTFIIAWLVMLSEAKDQCNLPQCPDGRRIALPLRFAQDDIECLSNQPPDYRGTLPDRTGVGNFASDKVTCEASVDNIGRAEDGLLTEKLVHLAIPVRWSLVGQQGRGPAEMACTYDIHPRGARLVSASAVNPGNLVLVERGRNKAVCQVIWTADPASSLRGQFTVQCVEDGRAPWEDELRQLEEQYQPVMVDDPRQIRPREFTRSDTNRRRRPRFCVEGEAEVIDGVQRVAGEVRQISEGGAQITMSSGLHPGSEFRLVLNVFDVSVALKARMKYLLENLGMGVEFQEIRRGDRPLLSYVLNKLRTRKLDEFPPVEVVTEPVGAEAG